MINKQSFNIIKGMRLDISPSKFNPEYLFDARNIRLTARGKDTLLSISNELGNTKIATINGEIKGYCVLNKYLVVFSHGIYNDKYRDYIYRIYNSPLISFPNTNPWVTELIYTNSNEEDSLNLSNEILTLGIYENENIQKVYWVDGVNQPRVINIVKDKLESRPYSLIALEYNSKSFDFVPTLKLLEKVTVLPKVNSSGKFSSGVILYAFTYYNRYGLESNIFYTTDLYNISYEDRGGSPEDTIGKAFEINIENLDKNFSYLRIYSIHRSSIDATPYVKRIADINYTTYTLEEERQNIGIYKRFNETPIICEDYINTPNEYKSIDKEYHALYAIDLAHAGNGPFYIFRKADYPNAVFLIDHERIVFADNALDNDTIIISVTSSISGPGGDGRLITTGDKKDSTRTTYLYKIVRDKTEVTGIHYTDTNTTGEAIDPTVLLYIGGEDIVAKTLCQKDNTLFLGNIRLTKPSIPENIKNKILEVANNKAVNISYSIENRLITVPLKEGKYYSYGNQLSDNPLTFKKGEHYRLGVLFLYKNGKWSEPIALISDDGKKEYTVNSEMPTCVYNSTSITYNVPKITINMNDSIAKDLVDLGFINARAVIVNPTINDRKIIMLGMLCPTMKWENSLGEEGSESNTSTYVSSWFMRAMTTNIDDTVASIEDNSIYEGTTPLFRHGEKLYNWDNHDPRRIEIEGYNGVTNKFSINQNIVTFHSPDIEFDTNILLLDSKLFTLRIIGTIDFCSNIGDIDIKTSSPALRGAGFFHTTLSTGEKVWGISRDYEAARNLISGLFYYDGAVGNNYEALDASIGGYMVYPWQSSGSLNNDINRPTDKGARSAVLKRKVISNLKFSKNNSKIWSGINNTGNDYVDYGITLLNIFNNNEISIIKINGENYMGNVDTLLTYPRTKILTKIYGLSGFATSRNNLKRLSDEHEELQEDLKYIKPSVRMKYKSSPHAVFKLSGAGTVVRPLILPKLFNGDLIWNEGIDATLFSVYRNLPAKTPFLPCLYLAEIIRTDTKNSFGGDNDAALRDNLWIPSGEPVSLLESTATNKIKIDFLHGDTYYQRYDCMKTYPFTQEDENSIIEIASFMVETRVNIDGRYDRNRGLDSNLNMSPLNFNLINPIYSLKNNFFNYRILDLDFYRLNLFSNSITWTGIKTTGEIVDNWTHIPMVNTIDVDGNLGEIVSIENYNNELYCFQNKGLSNILFNNRVLIPTGDNMPIEITNGYKVEGKRYISNNVGCQNQKAIKVTPNGIYFSDLYNSGIYLYNKDGLLDISTPRGFTNWVKDYSPNRTYYDTNNGDVYFISNKGFLNMITTTDISEDYKNCLCFSEKLNEFSSFMDYGNTLGMFNIADDFYAINKPYLLGGRIVLSDLYQLFSNTRYSNIFGVTYPYHLTYVANLDNYNDKIFNNIEFRADSFDYKDALSINITSLRPICPFNKLSVWNEYQGGESTLKNIIGKPSNLKLKFRIWRVNIPRNSTNRDRMRNPWLYISLEGDNNTNRMLLHDLLVYYYDNSIYGRRTL